MAFNTNGWDYIYNINLESLNKLILKQTVFVNRKKNPKMYKSKSYNNVWKLWKRPKRKKWKTLLNVS